MWTQIYTTHTHQLPTMHNTFVHTVHTNVCVMETCIDIYKQCARHMLHINKYTIHAREHRVHIQWARQAQRYTPFTFMHTQTHMRTHTSYTQASALTQPQAHTTSPHTGLSFPSSFPLIHPRFPSSCSVGTSNTWAVKRPGPRPNWTEHSRWSLLTVFCASSLPFFCFLGWRS